MPEASELRTTPVEADSSSRMRSAGQLGAAGWRRSVRRLQIGRSRRWARAVLLGWRCCERGRVASGGERGAWPSWRSNTRSQRCRRARCRGRRTRRRPGPRGGEAVDGGPSHELTGLFWGRLRDSNPRLRITRACKIIPARGGRHHGSSLPRSETYGCEPRCHPIHPGPPRPLTHRSRSASPVTAYPSSPNRPPAAPHPPS